MQVIFACAVRIIFLLCAEYIEYKRWLRNHGSECQTVHSGVWSRVSFSGKTEVIWQCRELWVSFRLWKVALVVYDFYSYRSHISKDFSWWESCTGFSKNIGSVCFRNNQYVLRSIETSGWLGLEWTDHGSDMQIDFDWRNFVAEERWVNAEQESARKISDCKWQVQREIGIFQTISESVSLLRSCKSYNTWRNAMT